ncbi:MAG: hypothetical protein CMO80_02815 [Verrucomicrobiales bacterium]|nr:hypothetical protein [Verrucomicrobiales bacterium]|tara:strand:+ start:313 stop:1068 length:756 start_codon:yes stop_codon:yes gene_type:complete
MNLETKDLTKSYLLTKALDRVSLKFEPGEIICVLGVNGAGKTTLLNCLAGLIVPDGGGVLIDGEPIKRDEAGFRKRLHLMPDFPNLFPDKTMIRNLTIMLRTYEKDVPGMEDKVVKLLKEFDLLPHANSSMNSLSRGQSYKGILTGLIAIDPELWLLDEPFASGMDPHGINSFKTHAQEASKRGRTIIYTTQILEVAERFSKKVCVIHKGNVVSFAPLEELKANSDVGENVLEELFRELRSDDLKADEMAA